MEDDVEADFESVLLNRSWNLHRASALYRFNPENLAQYSRQLSRIIRAAYEFQLSTEELARRSRTGERAKATLRARETAQGTGFFVQIDVQYFYLSRAARQNNLQKDLTVTQVALEEEAVSRLSSHVSTMILCSPGDEMQVEDRVFEYDGYVSDSLQGQEDMANDEDDEDNAVKDTEVVSAKTHSAKEKFHRFRFVLTRGKKSVLARVVSWLEKRFDCALSERPVPVPPRFLVEIASHFTREAVNGVLGSSKLMRDRHAFDEIREREAANEDTNRVDDLGESEAKRLDKLRDQVRASRAAQPLELTFQMPNSVSEAGLNTLHIAIPPSALRDLVNSSFDGMFSTARGSSGTENLSSSSTSNSDGLSDATNKLQERDGVRSTLSQTLDADLMPAQDPLLGSINRFVAQQLSIRLSGASLTQIATPVLMLSAEGRLKILSLEAVETILAQLAQLSEVETDKQK
mmetsp:Transcript_8596/g.15110  ORF Transcript_8596/g.15110 Transcript_8596/m.15110 type:complete len:461 (+) Transcript_8596:162-1544(+)